MLTSLTELASASLFVGLVAQAPEARRGCYNVHAAAPLRRHSLAREQRAAGEVPDWLDAAAARIRHDLPRIDDTRALPGPRSERVRGFH